MARGPSGRLVIEVDPAVKRDLHSALAADGLTLKDWFLQHVTQYIAERNQHALPGIANFIPAQQSPVLRAAEQPGKYKTKDSKA